jgi:hypothetical protein
MYGLFDIPPGKTRDLSFSFWLRPPVAAQPEAFTAHSVVLTNQFGKRHTLRRVRFRPIPITLTLLPQEPEEFPYMITAPGGDSWTPNSPANQFIVADPTAATLKSDNLDSLVGFYTSLTDDDQRTRFVNALLHRLHEKRGYLSVSYFIVCVLWRVGPLAAALQKAKRDLPAGETRVFGLSNVLMLLTWMYYRPVRAPMAAARRIDQNDDAVNHSEVTAPGDQTQGNAARISPAPAFRTAAWAVESALPDCAPTSLTNAVS